jgi:hypothetical protein
VKGFSSITRFFDGEALQPKHHGVHLPRIVGVVDHQGEGSMFHGIEPVRSAL